MALADLIDTKAAGNARSAEVRHARAEVVKRLRAGELELADALLVPELDTMLVWQLLERTYGPRTGQRLWRALAARPGPEAPDWMVGPLKTVGELSQRQRNELVKAASNG